MNISTRRSRAKHVGLFFQLPGSRLLCALLASFQVLLPSLAAALPIDGNVVAGQATIQKVSPTTLSIAQASDKAILNWNSFSVAANEAVHFIQPSVSSIALNRVIGVDPSVILGQLQANGRIFLINPNGILFGAGAQINVGGLLATTLQTRDEDFMAGRYLFAQDPLKGLKTVVNRGTIHVSDNGYVVLMAPGVSNEGMIVANLGTALLGSGQKFTLDLMGDGLIRYAINDKVLGHVTDLDGKPLSSAVSNSGSILADGGQVILSARASGDVFSSVVNQSGIIRAQSLINHGGMVRLEGSDPVANNGALGWQANLGKVQNAEGKVLNTGTIDVSAAESGAAQGQVTITGEKVGVAGTILARGADGARGGRVLLSSTEKTIVTSDSVIDTSGVGDSNAGNVVVWSDKNTMFGGTILAQGGTLGGNGGQIEVSGHENLGFFGQVNALAPRGITGSLLLDPLNITVATGGAVTLVQVDQFSDTPAAAQTIDPATINGAAANVTLQANNDITVTNAIAMTNNGVGITMQAGRDILVNAGVSTTNGNISLTANDSSSVLANRANGAAGDIIFGVGANLNSGTGNISLTIDPATAGNYDPGNITTVRNLTTTTGNITLNSPNTVSLSGAVNAGSGIVSINANSDGAGAQNFTMNAGSSITTTNATAGAVQVNVNAGGGGTGTAALRNITTGNGGTLTVATNTGGNATGGDITQTAATLLDVGTGTISLTTSTAAGRNIGAAATPILTTAGTITASTGTSGVFITESNGANITATATGAGAITLTSTTGALAIGGASSSGSGAITLAADTVNINAPLTSTGALTINPVAAAGNLTVSSSSSSNLTNGFSGIIIGNAAGTGVVTVNALTVSDPLTIRSPTTTGTVTVNGPLVGLGNGSVTLTGGTGATPITLNNVITTAGNAITLNDNVGLGADVTLDSTNGGGSPVGATINVTGTVNADVAANNRTLTLAGGTAGNVTLGGAVGGTQALQRLTVTSANSLTMPAVTTSSDIQLNAQNAVTLNGAVNAGSGTVAINANTDGAGAQAFTMNAGSSITTTNATAGAVQVNVNAAGGGTGTAALRNITTSNGGTLTVATNTGSNATGGDITQTPATLLDVGTGTINLTTSTAAGRNIGAAATPILTTAGTITATSGSNGIFLNNQTGVDLAGIQTTGPFTLTVNGPVTGSGTVVVSGTTTLAAGAANNITLNNAANTFSTVGITSGNNVALTDANALNLAASTVSGTLNVTAGGLISQSGALSVAGNAAFDTMAAATLGSVTLANGGALTLGTSTVGGNLLATTTAGDLTLPVGQTLTVVGNATLSTAGNVNLLGATRIGGTQTLNGGTGSTFILAADANLNSLALPAAGDITVNTTGTTASFAGGPILPVAINLSDASNSFGSSVQVTTAAPAFTGSTIATYNLTQSASVSLNAGQTLSVTDLGGTAGTRGNITLTNVGNSFNTVSFTGGNIAWQEANAVTIVAVSANAGITSSGALSITSAGPLTQTGAVTAAGLTTLAAGGNDITLTNGVNSFSTVGITSGNNVSLTDTNALVLSASTVTGNLALTTGGPLSQTGALAVTGATSFTATAANTDILLDTQANTFGGALSFAGAQANFRDVQLRNVNAGATVPVLAGLTNLRNLTLTFDNAAMTLPTLTASGTLNITAGGSINQSGVLAIGGTTTLATTVAGSDILLDTQANNLGSAVSFGGTLGNIRDVGLRNTNAGATIPSLAGLTSLRNLTLTFDNAPVALPSLTLTAGGNLNVTAGSSITETGTVTVPGTTTLATTVASSDILLDTQANNFGGAIAFSGAQTNIQDIGLRNLNAGATIPALAGVTNLRNLTLTFDNAPIVLPSLTTSGNLSATAGGAITQTGALTIAGITTLAAGINDITLSNGVNNFSTVGITSGNNVTLNDINALGLGASTVTGNLNVTTGGALTQSGALTVAGTTTLVAGANDITLNNAGNNFSTVGITSGNNVTLTDANALTINASTVSGNFSANASGMTVGGAVASTGGSLNLTGANTVTQLANLTANGANNVTVTTTTGPITMAASATTTSGTGGINYTAGTDVTLGSLSTGGGVNVSANGGSVFSAAGSGTNVTASAASTLQAFNGVVGTQAAPVTVNVNPGTLSIRATTAVAGISAFLTGTVQPSNALTLLNIPSGLVCFNGCPVTSSPVSGLTNSTFGYLNPDAIIPAYYPQPSGSVLISDITSVYMPSTLLQPSPVSLSSGNPAAQSMGPKAKAGASCKQGSPASFDVRCAVR